MPCMWHNPPVVFSYIVGRTTPVLPVCAAPRRMLSTLCARQHDGISSIAFLPAIARKQPCHINILLCGSQTLQPLKLLMNTQDPCILIYNRHLWSSSDVKFVVLCRPARVKRQRRGLHMRAASASKEQAHDALLPAAVRCQRQVAGIVSPAFE